MYAGHAPIDRRQLLAIPIGLVLAGATRDEEVPFLPTPPAAVEAMLDLAALTRDDLLIDLGAGDGRIAIAAGKRGARAIGVEIDAQLVLRARRAAADAGVSERVVFREGDLFRTPIRDASVVALYLLPAVNLRLRPRLLTELRPGTRIVSHAFTMGDWRPDAHRLVEERHVYLWVVPAVAGGDWVVTLADGSRQRLSIEQRFQDITGTLDGLSLEAATLRGDALAFTAGGRRYAGRVREAAIDGEGWRAIRA